MVLELFPLEYPFEILIKSFSETSSSFCASKVVDEEGLESSEPLVESFRETVNLDLHLDLPLSGNAASGLDLFIDSVSNGTVETDANLEGGPPEFIVRPGERGGSTGLIIAFIESSVVLIALVLLVLLTPEKDCDETPVRGVSRSWQELVEVGDIGSD